MKTSAIFSAMILAVAINIHAAGNEEKPLKKVNEEHTAGLFAVLETIEEPADNLEAWMLDPAAFSETNEFIEVEEWMLDVSIFGKPETATARVVVDEYFTADYAEDLLVIEPWMLSLNIYGPDYFEADFEEEFLPIEDWMFNF